MPADRDYLSATSIPVAGIALGRPHGPRIRSVHVALYVGGRLVEGTDLEVYAGRFAGVLGLDAAIDHGRRRAPVQRPGQPGAGRRDPVDHARHAIDHAVTIARWTDADTGRGAGATASAPQRAAMTAISTL